MIHKILVEIEVECDSCDDAADQVDDWIFNFSLGAQNVPGNFKSVSLKESMDEAYEVGDYE